MRAGNRVVMAVCLCVCALAVAAAPSWAQSWAAPVNVSNSPSDWSSGQSFTVDSRGKVHITYADWNDGSGYGARVYYTNNDTADGRFATPSVVPIPGYWLYDHTTQLTHTSDDTLHLAVTAKICCYSSNQTVIYLNKPRGGQWSAPSQLANESTEFVRSHGIVALPDDSVFVLMVDDNGGYARLFDRVRSPSGTWTGQENLYTSAVNGRYPNGWCSVIEGDLYVTYDQAFAGGGSFYKVKHSGVWGAWKQVGFQNAQTASRLTISKSPLTGEMAAVYGYDAGDGANYGSGNLNFDIYAKFSSDGGQTWGPDTRVSPGNSLDRGATCVYDSSGSLHVVWYGQLAQGDRGNALYRKRGANGVWGSQVNVSNSSDWAGTGFQAIQRSGCTLHLIYTSSPSFIDVWYTKMDLLCDTQPPAPVSGFSATNGEERTALSWTNPADSDFSATVVRMSTAGYPAIPSDGAPAAARYAAPGSADSVTLWPLTAGLTHYFSAFAVDSAGNAAAAAQAVAAPVADVSPPARVTGFTAVPYTSENLTLKWTNPADIDFKGTLIRFSTAGYPTGPTDPQSSTACDLQGSPGSSGTGLHGGLTAGQTCYYSAFPYDTKGHYSAGVHATGVPASQTCQDAKTLPDGGAVDLRGKIVIGVFADESNFYVEEPNRASGIRVAAPGGGLAVGDRVNVSGLVGTRRPDGVNAVERQITSAVVVKVSSGPGLPPVAMNCPTVGGGPNGGCPGVRDGSTPPDYGFGLSTIGSLVRISGRVTLKITSYIYIDDGSRIPDISGRTGVMIRCPDSSIPCAVNDIVAVTGVVVGSLPAGWDANRRYIRLRDYSDLQVFGH